MSTDELFDVKKRLLYDGFMHNNHTIVRETLETYPQLLNVSIETVDSEDEDYDEDDGMTPLLAAVTWSDYKMVQMLLEKFHVDPNKPDYSNVTPIWCLTVADKDGSKAHYADLLVKYGADVTIKTFTGISPLYVAVENGNFLLVEKLISYGADAKEVDDYDGKTMLHNMACYYNQEVENSENNAQKTIDLIVNAGLDIDKKNDSGQTALDIAKLEGRDIIANILLKKHANKNSKVIPDDFMK